MSGDQIITFGRYKNKKTFNQVLNEDRKYCEDLLSDFLSVGQSYSKTANTEDFIKYLKEENLVISDARERKDETHCYAKPDRSLKEVLIRQLDGKKFAEAFKLLHNAEFKKILNSSDIIKASIHEKSKLRLPDGRLGYFYGYVFAKCAAKILNVRLFEDYDLSKRLPVKLKWDNLGEKNIEILQYFDKGDTDIIEELDGYLKSYYFEVNTREEIRHFLCLISDMENCNLQILLDVDLFKNKKRYFVDELKKWLFLYLVCKEQKITVYDDDIRYFYHNFDIFSIEYLISFLQSFRKYLYYKGDICGVIENILNMAQLRHVCYSQYYASMSRRPYVYLTVSDIDIEIIKNIEAYVRKVCENKTADARVRINLLDFLVKNKEQFQNCKKCRYYSVERQLELMEECIKGKKDPEENILDWIDKSFLGGTIPLIVDRCIIDFCYSKNCKTLPDFYYLIIKAALIGEPFEEFIIYNGYLGEEYKIRIVEDKEAVKNFIRTYRHPDTLKSIM